MCVWKGILEIRGQTEFLCEILSKFTLIIMRELVSIKYQDYCQKS